MNARDRRKLFRWAARKAEAMNLHTPVDTFDRALLLRASDVQFRHLCIVKGGPHSRRCDHLSARIIYHQERVHGLRERAGNDG